MNLLAANLLASALSFVASGLLAAWYVAPALSRRSLAQALTMLMWVQAFGTWPCRSLAPPRSQGLRRPSPHSG